MNGILMPGDFVRESLELHLFFARIMKEHSIFLQAGFVGKDTTWIQQAEMFRCQFTEVLQEAVILANGVISQETLDSGEWITDKTSRAEHITQELSGIPIETIITADESQLVPETGYGQSQLEGRVSALNNNAIGLINELIVFKTKILEGMLQCKLYTFNFPLLIIHIRREAIFYVQHLIRLQKHLAIDFISEALEEERFWNRQMAEHAQFIRQLLDPTETGLIFKAEDFSRQFERLEQNVPPSAQSKTEISKITRDTIAATRALRDFKAAGTEGILTCKIKSIIIPLLGDHVLREANHYLRVLNRSKRDLQL